MNGWTIVGPGAAIVGDKIIWWDKAKLKNNLFKPSFAEQRAHSRSIIYIIMQQHTILYQTIQDKYLQKSDFGGISSKVIQKGSEICQEVHHRNGEINLVKK